MNKKRIIVPPIKIQGIKTKLVPWIKELLPKHCVKNYEHYQNCICTNIKD